MSQNGLIVYPLVLLALSSAERRFAVACGAAAGLAGAPFVAEIVLGGISVASFGPLLIAAVPGVLRQVWRQVVMRMSFS